MAIIDARPSAFTQLSITSEWEALLSCAGLPEGAVDGQAALGHWLTPSLDIPGRNIVIDSGQVVVKGMLWRCDAPVSTPIAAASAQNRIDRLVLRLTRGASTSATVIVPTIIQGTPSGSPAIPAITQTLTGIWDLPVCFWNANSNGTLTNLLDERRFTNDQWHDMRPLLNSFIGTISGTPPPQYRFSNDCKKVEVAGFMQSPPTTGNYNGVSFFTLPWSYRPVNSSGDRIPVCGCPQASASSYVPCIQPHNDGSFTLQFSPTSLVQCVISLNGSYHLEDQNGFLQS